MRKLSVLDRAKKISDAVITKQSVGASSEGEHNSIDLGHC